MSTGAFYVEGEDRDGTVLTDVAPARLSAALDYQSNSWRASLQYQYRFSESNVAPSEQPIDSANLLAASVSRSWPGGLTLSLWGRNLLDEDYRLTTDSLAAQAAQRSIGISLSWVGAKGQR